MTFILETTNNLLYNIFMVTNISHKPEKSIGEFLDVLGQPVRIKILLTIGSDEACVCHLENALRLRQAYISQHLMALRNVEILITRREGRFIFYQLKDSRLLDLIKLTAKILGFKESEIDTLLQNKPIPNCCCPHCASYSEFDHSSTERLRNLFPPNITQE